MSSKRNQMIDEDESPNWLATFADLMTLLLVFFVLLFSMSSLKQERFEEAVRSLTLALDSAPGSNSLIELDAQAPTPKIPQELTEEVLPATQYSLDDGAKPNDAEARRQLLKLQHDWTPMSQELEQSFEMLSLSDAVEIADPKDGKLRLRIDGSALFESGSAQFDRRMMPLLDVVVNTLRRNPQYKVNIQGHTDDIPIETAQFPSNWELSAVRATTVLRYFMRGGLDPERLTATGYGDSLPVEPNDSAKNRARNRRIEFVLEYQVE
ncbi:OmpA/MotB family protein [Marinobacterium arenosum]|uniref:OmpA/MotB family protein n=1 Tax=Marinobacterium arenosum TaxID=2862496 RepID=UPI001C951445|nr:OmpA family protein [Marinobacterium arenosum]MBY4679008.1 OmpA family protein [Marinobacterium arenosum]